jgi:hypothetical protein
MALRFRPLHATFGAEVIGADLATNLDDGTIAAIEAAWQRYSILLFRNVEMTPAQHVAFTRRLGPLHIMEPLEFNLPGFPEVMVASNIEKDAKPIGMKRAPSTRNSPVLLKRRPSLERAENFPSGPLQSRQPSSVFNTTGSKHGCGSALKRTPSSLTKSTPASANEVKLREALPTDVDEMHALLEGFARRGLLLPRTVEEVYRNFREFVVAEHDGRVVGCAHRRCRRRYQ